MNDSEIRQITDQLSRSMDARIRQLVDEKFRERTGVVAKQYNWGTVDATGRVLSAQDASGGGTIGLAVYTTSAARTMVDSTDTIINYNNKIKDVNNLVTTGTSWKYTCPVDGLYIAVAALGWSAINWTAGTSTRIKLFQDGVNVVNLDWQSHGQGAAQVRMLHGAGFVNCTVGDLLDIRGYQDSGSNQTTVSIGGTSSVAIWCLLPA